MEQQIRRARLSDGHGQGHRCESRERRGSREEDVSLSAEWPGKSIETEACLSAGQSRIKEWIVIPIPPVFTLRFTHLNPVVNCASEVANCRFTSLLAAANISDGDGKNEPGFPVVLRNITLC